MSRNHSTAILRATAADAMADPAIREMVEATARGIAERTGVELLNVWADEQSVEVTVDGSVIIAVGLVAELRRTTDQWHRTHTGTPLWVEAS